MLVIVTDAKGAVNDNIRQICDGLMTGTRGLANVCAFC